MHRRSLSGFTKTTAWKQTPSTIFENPEEQIGEEEEEEEEKKKKKKPKQQNQKGKIQLLLLLLLLLLQIPIKASRTGKKGPIPLRLPELSLSKSLSPVYVLSL